MTTEPIEGTEPEARGLSRRNALKAGVAAGVGIAAWSGASITSLGGTPAYAAGCTGAIPPVDISGGCRNTTQSTDPFSYQALSPSGLPSGFSFTAVPNNTPCADNFAGTFTFPDTLTCTVRFEFRGPDCPNDELRGTKTFGPAAGPTLPITYSCPDPATIPPGQEWSNTRYTITAFCFTGATPPDPSCF